MKKFNFQALRVTFLVIFWSCGTDETFLKTYGKNLRFFSALFFRKNFDSVVEHPFTLKEVLGLEEEFCELKAPFSAIWYSFPKIFSLNGFLFPVSSFMRASLRIFFGTLKLIK